MFDDSGEPFTLGPPPPLPPPPPSPSAAGPAAPHPAHPAPKPAPAAPPKPKAGGGGAPAHAAPKPSAPAHAEPPGPIADAGQRLFYPLFQAPLASYKTGARWFGAPRSGGRHHAAVDLLAPHLSRIRAVADGVVIQAPYYFYTGTNALEVNHPGVGIVRYGEIDMHKVVHLKAGDRVRAGDLVAYVGRLDSGSSMLHFELYSGKGRGPLTVRANPPFQRRSDLVDPTSLMDELLAAFLHKH
jgi:murein DD-endopeptidase MepM/ murein hydrolase activator NlpD